MPEKQPFEGDKEQGVPLSPEAAAEEKEVAGPLPTFLYNEDDRIMTGMKAGADVTEQYRDYMKLLGRRAEELPPFLHERRGKIYLDAADDSDVTEAWMMWANDNSEGLDS